MKICREDKIRTEKSSAWPKSETLRHVVFRVRALTARFFCHHILNDRTKKLTPNIFARYFMNFQSIKQRPGEIAMSRSMVTVISSVILVVLVAHTRPYTHMYTQKHKHTHAHKHIVRVLAEMKAGEPEMVTRYFQKHTCQELQRSL